jgi:Kef-type K+ transport system membrane component KefB
MLLAWDACSMLLEITVALLFAKIFSFIFNKIKQPGVLGEILAGIFLGPCCVGLLSGSSLNILNTSLYKFSLNMTSPEFKEIAFIGVVFLLFIVGLETDLSDLKKTRKIGIGVGTFGVLIPFLFGCIVGLLFHLNIIQSMAIGTIFLATSTTIAIRVLSDMDLLASRIGLTLRTALVVNDILAMIFFALVFGAGNSFVLLLQISLFFIITILFGFIIIWYTSKRNTKRNTPIIILTSGLVICFLFAAFAENMGLTSVIGAFIAGLFIKKTPQAGILVEYIKTIGYMFFIPLFFVWVGASFNFLSIFQSNQIMPLLIFCIAFIVFAMLGNFIGSSIGARIAGMKKREAISVGIGMMPVMGVALIIVSTGIERGIFGDPSGVLANQIKTATLFLIFTSCFLSPLLLKRHMASHLLKEIGKTKTKLSFYKHPHCYECGSTLRLISGRNEWFCDICQKTMVPIRSERTYNYKMTRTLDKKLQYIIGAVTIVIFALIIQNMDSTTLIEKIISLIGIFIGTLIGFLTVRFLFINKSNI